MIDLDKPVQTREGNKVRIICTDMNGEDSKYPIVGLIERRGEESIGTWTLDGKDSVFCDLSDFDLINVPVKHKGWMNIYPEGHAGHVHSKKETADKCADSRIACIQIEYTEGEGL